MENKKLVFVAGLNGSFHQVALKKKFSHYVDGVRYWFALTYNSTDEFGPLNITEWQSGARLAPLANGYFYLSQGGVMRLVDEAKKIIDILSEKKGKKLVRQTIDNAIKNLSENKKQAEKQAKKGV